MVTDGRWIHVEFEQRLDFGDLDDSVITSWIFAIPHLVPFILVVNKQVLEVWQMLAKFLTDFISKMACKTG